MIKAIVMGIEGTTTRKDFTQKVLEPYARQQMEPFIRSHYPNHPEVSALVKKVAIFKKLGEDDVDGICAQLHEWMVTEARLSLLTALQVCLWRSVLRRGIFKGHIFSDVATSFWKWQSKQIELHTFSNGKTEAQRLILTYSLAGDLSRLIGHFFDAKTGPKNEVASYLTIAETIGFHPNEVIYLSDVYTELKAAHEAGMQVFQVMRDETLDLQIEFPKVNGLDEIELEDRK